MTINFHQCFNQFNSWQIKLLRLFSLEKFAGFVHPLLLFVPVVVAPVHNLCLTIKIQWIKVTHYHGASVKAVNLARSSLVQTQNNVWVSIPANFFWDISVRLLSRVSAGIFEEDTIISEDSRRSLKSSEDDWSLRTRVNTSSRQVLFTSKLRDHEEGIVIYSFYTSLFRIKPLQKPCTIQPCSMLDQNRDKTKKL